MLARAFEVDDQRGEGVAGYTESCAHVQNVPRRQLVPARIASASIPSFRARAGDS